MKRQVLASNPFASDETSDAFPGGNENSTLKKRSRQSDDSAPEEKQNFFDLMAQEGSGLSTRPEQSADRDERLSLQKICEASEEFFGESGRLDPSWSSLRRPEPPRSSEEVDQAFPKIKTARNNEDLHPLDDSERMDIESPPVEIRPEELPVAADLVETLSEDLPDAASLLENLSFEDMDSGSEVVGDEDRDTSRFREYQTSQWMQKMEELREFKREHGHSSVPHGYPKNIALARWVKRQRYQYKQLMDGKDSTMTDDRIEALESIGFTWDCKGSTWEERIAALCEYRNQHHSCNVPTHYPENPQLGMWVKSQRRQYKLFIEGRQSGMTHERISELEKLGFSWNIRTTKKSSTA